MAARRPLQPLDVATGVISGTLAASFFVLAGLAALPDDSTAPVAVNTAVVSQP